jgi:hypothetical protein
MIITRIREPSGTNAQTEVRDHGFPKEAGMAGLSISPNHRPHTPAQTSAVTGVRGALTAAIAADRAAAGQADVIR